MRGKTNRIGQLLCMLFLIWPVHAKYGGGSGTPDEPYLISTAEQLNAIGAVPDDWDKHFKLVADIDLRDFGDSSFNLIGSSVRSFSGVFDGNGHTISNFTYIVTGNEEQSDDTAVRGIGFFRNVNNPYAVIRDLDFADPNIHPASTCSKRVEFVGILVGRLGSGQITGCCVNRGRVMADSRVGGLVGENSGTISDCYTTCLVQAFEQRVVDVERRSEFIGGVVGFNRGEIIRCHATGDVSGEAYIGGLAGRCYQIGKVAHSWASGDIAGVRQVGGLIGGNDTSLAHCYATGRITGRFHVGGLAGSSEGKINNCYATGDVSASSQQGGGLVGSHSGVMSECCATGSVVVSDWGGGGLVGFNSGTIQRCYSRCQVSGGYSIGGLVGRNRKGMAEFAGTPLLYNGIIEDSYAQGGVSGVSASLSTGGLVGSVEGGVLSRCYAAGKVSGSRELGGLAGTVSGSDPFEIEHSFWDITISSQMNSAGGTGLSTESMQDVNTFLTAGWDFTGETTNGVADIWTMSPDSNTYPQLSWDVEPEPFLIFEFDEDPNWVTQGQWQFGKPQSLGGTVHGHSDPNSGYTGDNVYGVNLFGDYNITDTSPYYLTAGPFDCSQYSWVKLQFARWLNSDEADYVRTVVEVSTDQTVWHTIWEYDDFYHPIEEGSWNVVEYVIGSIADRQPTVHIRWGYQVYWVNLNATDESEKIDAGPWNLGHLFEERIIQDPKIFYCPSAGKGNRYKNYVGKFKWPFPSDIFPNPSHRIRVGYNYYPQGDTREKLENGRYAYKSANTLTSINSRSTISMDRIGSWKHGMHRQMGKSSGINILYGDGSVKFRVNKDTEEALWYPNPYNDADNFRALLYTLSQ